MYHQSTNVQLAIPVRHAPGTSVGPDADRGRYPPPGPHSCRRFRRFPDAQVRWAVTPHGGHLGIFNDQSQPKFRDSLMTWLSGNPPQSRVEIPPAGPASGLTPGRRRARQPRAARRRLGAARAREGEGDDLRGTGLRGARGLRRAGLRDRRRAGRAGDRARSRPPRPAGAAARERRPGAAGRGAGAVAGREPRPRDPPCAGDHRRPAARRGLEPLGRALPAVRPGRLRGPALARSGTCRPGRSGPPSSSPGSGRPAPGSPPATRCSPSRCPGSRPTRPSASRASSAGATGRGSRSCTGPSSPPPRTCSSRSGRR